MRHRNAIPRGHQTQTLKGHPLCGLHMPAGCGGAARAAVHRCSVFPLQLAGPRVPVGPGTQEAEGECEKMVPVSPFIFGESPNRSLTLS